MRSTLPSSARHALSACVALLVFCALGIAGPARASAAQTAAAQAHFMWSKYSLADVDRQMDAAKTAGIGLLRVDVGWSSIEQDGKGQYNQWYLDKLDQVVAKARQRNLKLLLTFWQTPCWASTAPDSAKQACAGTWWDRDVQYYAPRDPRDYADALAFMVRRYGDGVAAWEVWNEPNDDYYFRAGDPAAAYAAIAKAAYPAAKAAYPGTTIVAGSLANSDYTFTQKLYDRGIKGSFDAWSIHPYSGDRSPLQKLDAQNAAYTFIQGVPAVHDTMLRNGDDKPLWLTEFGWSTCDVRNQEPWRNGVDEATQADYLTKAFTQMRQWSYVPVGVWFNIQDSGTNKSDRDSNYGLLHTDGSAKPAYAAMASAAAALGTPGGDTTAAGTTGSTTDPAPVSAPTSPGKVKHGRIRLRAQRVHGAVWAFGRATGTHRLVIRAYAYSTRHHRWHKRASYRVTVRVHSSGRFKKRLSRRRVTRGKWRITAAAPRPVARAASSRIR